MTNMLQTISYTKSVTSMATCVMASCVFRTEIGNIIATVCPKGLHSLSLTPTMDENTKEISALGKVSYLFVPDDQILKSDTYQHMSAALQWLRQYFEGEQDGSLIPQMCFEGISDYRTKVYLDLMKTRPGETLTYKDLSHRVSGDNGKGCRAVGSAMKNNPFVLLVPCHRVIPTMTSKKGGSDGDIGKYAHGSALKKMLIDFEKKYFSISN